MSDTTSANAPTEVRPFRVDVPEGELEELRRRIDATRWPTKELVADRSQGVQLAALQELARYWTSDYDWRRCEARLNALPQFTTEIDGLDIHFIHVKSAHENALPLIMTHGWPGSVVELLETIGPLTDGVHTLELQAFDASANFDPTPVNADIQTRAHNLDPT